MAPARSKKRAVHVCFAFHQRIIIVITVEEVMLKKMTLFFFFLCVCVRASAFHLDGLGRGPVRDLPPRCCPPPPWRREVFVVCRCSCGFTRLCCVRHAFLFLQMRHSPYTYSAPVNIPPLLSSPSHYSSTFLYPPLLHSAPRCHVNLSLLWCARCDADQTTYRPPHATLTEAARLLTCPRTHVFTITQQRRIIT
jgi:hypothetical protein